MASKKKETTPAVVDEFNDGWAHMVGEGGQGELAQVAGGNGNGNGHQPRPAAATDVWATLGEPMLVPIDSIQPNPYQPRTVEDPAAIAEIALSIYRNGLMQVPVARANGALFQLAFGHTRLAAFVLLATKGLPEHDITADDRYTLMPLRIMELDDRQMFEVAVGENIKRRDLNPMEQAAAMQAYMSEFKASSRQAAELFGVNDATVRGSVRLLKLPVPVQEKIATGEISQGAARQLLQVSKLASGEQLTTMATSIASGNKPDTAIESTLSTSKGVVKMGYHWLSEDPAKANAGSGLWKLSDVTLPEILGELTPNDLGKLGLDEITPRTRQKFYLQELKSGKDAEILAGENPTDADAIERIAHLLHPPACLSCPFHVYARNQHLCGLKLCHDRRAAVWAENETQRLSRDLSIPVYDRASEGNAVPLQENYWPNTEEYEEHDKLFKKKDPGLRLTSHRGDSKHRWTESFITRVVMVGPGAQKILTDRKNRAEQKKTAEATREQQYAFARAKREAAEKFYSKHIPMLFSPALAGLANIGAICGLLGEDLPRAAKRSTALPGLHLKLADFTLRKGFYGWNEGPVAVAHYFVKVAARWDIALTVDLVDIAKAFEPQPVSTETPSDLEAPAEDLDDGDN